MDKFHGISYRIPTITVSVIDLVTKLERAASIAEINAAFANTSSKSLAGLLGYTDLPLVSSDFRGDSRSSIVDGLMTTVLSEENMVHIVGCYDNEWGYASRIADLANFISECEHNVQRLKRARVVKRDYLERALRMVSFVPEEPPL
jgi:glyceraldehyde 3-phosphate dehydrogenase